MSVFRFATFEGNINAFLNSFRVGTAISLETKKLEKLGLGWSRFLGCCKGR